MSEEKVKHGQDLEISRQYVQHCSDFFPKTDRVFHNVAMFQVSVAVYRAIFHSQS